eukprot:CAMPEP_0177547078 /NCGR_PEP_ID=MMETSP0369-20130122/63606_1 /TAXON_ID=447022 ORGANISM="Scrippsiella hangoei-like, Strain SHHI-4" /NCGR_SAMPLE_ID=MMETSP0369 /ASSEMBLY_ACC=CAM_ASM_000364 /LENGTH=79 /DNA_ID=CAMNT_0019031707 /DNA_START=314 /DNA_END=549 /DNA_ORIENTATION=+
MISVTECMARPTKGQASIRASGTIYNRIRGVADGSGKMKPPALASSQLVNKRQTQMCKQLLHDVNDLTRVMHPPWDWHP